jgi:CubicO group peptidase (beta-lactamase class C family)
MTRATFDSEIVSTDPERAIGHWRPFTAAGLPLPITVPMVAASGLYTSLDDALRFLTLHLRGGTPVLPPGLIGEQYRVPFGGHRLGYGLGVYMDEWAPGVRLHHHGGSGFGFRCQLAWVPGAQLGVVVLTNSFDHDLQNELTHQFVEHVGAALPPEAVSRSRRNT